MKVPCLPGRHRWRVDNSDPERPVLVCDRCGHYRDDVSWTDVSQRLGRFRVDPWGGGGGGGG